MGLYDRDYARSEDRGTGRGARGRWSLPGGLSFNTWLIIVNIAVFVLGATLNAPPFLKPRLLAVQYAPGVTDVQKKRQAYFEQAFDPRVRGLQTVRIVVDPETPATDAFGRVVVDDATGRPIPAQLGIQQAIAVPFTEAWGHFSTERAFFGLEVWRFVTFQFLHANLMHLVFNMLGLWFVGGLVEQYLGSKRYAAFYLTCGIFGALMYLLLNFLGNYVFVGVHVPGLLFDDVLTPLVGASAGIFGVLMAAAFIAPSAIVEVMGILPLKMRTAVYLFTAMALASLLMGSSNKGGEAAHLGGAIAGFFFIRRTHLLRDFFDVLGDSRASDAEGGVADGSGAGGTRSAPARGAVEPGEVDRILAKVAAQGLSSLSEAERATLRAATEAHQRA